MNLRRHAIAIFLMVVAFLLWSVVFKGASAAWDRLGWKHRLAILFLFFLLEVSSYIARAVAR